MIIKSKQQAVGLIVGFSIRHTGHDDAMLRVSIDNGAIVYQGCATEIANMVTNSGIAAIKGRYLSVELVRENTDAA